MHRIHCINPCECVRKSVFGFRFTVRTQIVLCRILSALLEFPFPTNQHHKQMCGPLSTGLGFEVIKKLLCVVDCGTRGDVDELHGLSVGVLVDNSRPWLLELPARVLIGGRDVGLYADGLGPVTRHGQSPLSRESPAERGTQVLHL